MSSDFGPEGTGEVGWISLIEMAKKYEHSRNFFEGGINRSETKIMSLSLSLYFVIFVLVSGDGLHRSIPERSPNATSVPPSWSVLNAPTKGPSQKLVSLHRQPFQPDSETPSRKAL